MQLQKKTFLALASDFAKIEGETPSFKPAPTTQYITRNCGAVIAVPDLARQFSLMPLKTRFFRRSGPVRARF
jgi:hypothetical protein